MHTNVPLTGAQLQYSLHYTATRLYIYRYVQNLVSCLVDKPADSGINIFSSHSRDYSIVEHVHFHPQNHFPMNGRKGTTLFSLILFHFFFIRTNHRHTRHTKEKNLVKASKYVFCAWNLIDRVGIFSQYIGCSDKQYYNYLQQFGVYYMVKAPWQIFSSEVTQLDRADGSERNCRLITDREAGLTTVSATDYRSRFIVSCYLHSFIKACKWTIWICRVNLQATI